MNSCYLPEPKHIKELFYDKNSSFLTERAPFLLVWIEISALKLLGEMNEWTSHNSENCRPFIDYWAIRTWIVP